MTLVFAVVVIALVSASPVARRIIPSESLIAMGAAMIAVIGLLQLDRLG